MNWIQITSPSQRAAETCMLPLPSAQGANQRDVILSWWEWNYAKFLPCSRSGNHVNWKQLFHVCVCVCGVCVGCAGIWKGAITTQRLPVPWKCMDRCLRITGNQPRPGTLLSQLCCSSTTDGPSGPCCTFLSCSQSLCNEQKIRFISLNTSRL